MSIDPTHPTSLHLIRQAREGDSLAWGDLDTRYRDRLTALAAYLMGPQLARQASPDDLVQEAWSGVFARFEEFDYRGAGSLYALLAQHIRHLARSWGRKGATRQGDSSLDASQAPQLPSDEATPSLIAAESERSASIARNLTDDRLPRPYAKALVAFHLEGRSGADVAAELDISEQTFHKQVSRARKLYRELFGDDLQSLL